MKTKKLILALTISGALAGFPGCSMNIDKGDIRDRNLEKGVVEYLDSVPGVEYVGMSDTHEIDGNQFQAVVIYYTVDTEGKKVERNALVTTNGECSVIYSWEDMDTRVIEDTKQKVAEKMEEYGISTDGSIIDALINLKKYTR